jgi:citronellol/citronellal dehydrogenase
MSKYGMSMCTLGMAEELRADGIAVNSLWPRTTIATAAVEVHFPAEILRASRHATIMAEAAHAILTSEALANTGNFCIDEEVLRARGETDFSRYAVTPGVAPYNDLFID